MAGQGPRRRCPPWVSAHELFSGLVYHALQSHGTLATHVRRLTGKAISDSALAQRRATLPWTVFEAVMDVALRPLADEQAHPQAFYAGLRLVGLDGTRFFCANTPRLLGEMTKAASRRVDAAFAKLGAALLVELGTHAPLAAAVAQEGEGELTRAGRLLARLPPGSLLLADRLYGSGAFVVRLQKAAERAGQGRLPFWCGSAASLPPGWCKRSPTAAPWWNSRPRATHKTDPPTVDLCGCGRSAPACAGPAAAGARCACGRVYWMPRHTRRWNW